MWDKNYRDYPKDEGVKKHKVAPSHGIIGCEMHEVVGWGDSYHYEPPRKRGLVSSLLTQASTSKKREES